LSLYEEGERKPSFRQIIKTRKAVREIFLKFVAFDDSKVIGDKAGFSEIPAVASQIFYLSVVIVPNYFLSYGGWFFTLSLKA